MSGFPIEQDSPSTFHMFRSTTEVFSIVVTQGAIINLRDLN